MKDALVQLSLIKLISQRKPKKAWFQFPMEISQMKVADKNDPFFHFSEHELILFPSNELSDPAYPYAV
jgi:hypothetical protein